MATVLAGQYGPEPLFDDAGNLLKASPVSVFTVGTSTLVTLYTDKTKAVTRANPISTDTLGNLTFFTNPGQVDLVSVGGTRLTINVYADVNETVQPPIIQQPNEPVGPVLGDLWIDTDAVPSGTGYIPSIQKGVALGVATLGADGKLLPAQSGTIQFPSGLVGNGVADDTAAIQAAINALPASAFNFDPRGGGKVILPTGTFRLTSALTLNNNVELVGAGDGTTLLVDYNGPAVLVTATDAFGKNNWAVRHLKIMCTSTTTGAIGIKCVAFGVASGGHKGCSIEDVHILGTGGGTPVRGQFLTAMDLDFFIECQVSGVFVLGGTKGLILRNASNATLFAGCFFREIAIGVEMDGNSLPFFVGCTIEGCTTYGMNVLSGSPRMSQMHFESGAGAAIDLRVVSGQNGSLLGGELIKAEFGVGGAPNQVNDWLIAGTLIRNSLNIGTGCLNMTVVSGTGALTDNGVDSNFVAGRFDSATRASTVLKAAFKTGQSTTALRPPAATYGTGATWYDTTTKRPIWSDGTEWREATTGVRTPLPPALDYFSSELYSSNTTAALAVGTAYGMLIVPRWDVTVDRIGVWVTVAAAAGSVIRLGAYSVSAGGWNPGALLADFGNVTTDVLNLRETTISYRFEQGVPIWLVGYIPDTSGSPTLYVSQIADKLFSDPSAAVVVSSGLGAARRTGLTGPNLPSPFARNAAGGNTPTIIVRSTGA